MNRPSDFDDVILERNIYDKCGYGLCGRPNVKVAGNAQNRVIWGKRSGPAFTVVPKRELEKWCSKQCEERAVFVRVQLGKEPAWLRDQPVGDIKLLDESRQENATDVLIKGMDSLNVQTPVSPPDLADDFRRLASYQIEKQGGYDEVAERLQTLSLERGQSQQLSAAGTIMQIVEKPGNDFAGHPPPQISSRNPGTIEGHKPRKVRFITHGDGEEDDDDDLNHSDVDVDTYDDDDDDDDNHHDEDAMSD